jgi:hypothetical protein
MTLSIDYGAPPFAFTGPWECAIDGEPVQQELPLAGFFDDESGDWHPVCDDCAGSDTATIQRRLDHYADNLSPDDGRAPWLRRLALHDWELRTAGYDAKGMWLICQNGHWFRRPAQPDADAQIPGRPSGSVLSIPLARCPECARWVGMPEV